MSNQEAIKTGSETERFKDAFRFIDFLFHIFRRGFVKLRYFNPEKPRAIEKPDYLPLPLPATSGQALTELINRHAGQLVSFGPAPRLKKTIKPRKNLAGADEIGCLWAELRYDKTPGGVLGAVELIHGLRLRPSIVVSSGGAREIYYVLKTPLRDAGLLDWKRMAESLNICLNGVGTAEAAINLDKTLPLPGTLNPNYDVEVYCSICEDESSWLRYSAEEIKEFLTEAESAGRNKKTGSGAGYSSGREPEGASFLNYSPTVDELRERKVPLRVIQAIFGGSATPGGGFEKKEVLSVFNRDLFVAEALLKENFAWEEIKAVFRSNPSGCGSGWAKARDGEKYLEDIISRASAKIKKHNSSKDDNSPIPVDSMPPNYRLDESGAVWLLTPAAKEGKEAKQTFVSSSPLRITGIRENIDTGQISVVISYEYLGKARSTTISRSQMCDTRALVSVLSGEGAPLNSNNARLLVSYLAAYEHAFAELIPRKKVTSRFGRGRAADRFFLPGLASGIEFAPDGSGDAGLYKAYSARQGSLGGWLEIMNSLESESLMIPQIAVLASFVPPLQRFLQIPNFILDIFGSTSSGKSTTLKLAASVYGRPLDPDSLIYQWMNTKLAVEQIAAVCSELPIYLDDAQHCSDDLKRAVIYMIANGKGKGRGSAGGGMRETRTWQTVALSTSEEPLHEASEHEGVRGRLLPVGGLVAPFPSNSAFLVQSLERAVGLNYGFAGETFIRHLNSWSDADWIKRERRYALLRGELARNSSSDIVGRVGGYIAAIGIAGEIACPLLGLNFKPDIIVAWLLNHIQEQQSSQNLVLIALRVLADYYLSNLSSFAGTDGYNASRKALQGVSKKLEYVGFMRNTLDAVFARHKWNQTMILNKMSEAGVLYSTESDRYTKKVTFQGIKHRLVCIKWSAILPDDAGL